MVCDQCKQHRIAKPLLLPWSWSNSTSAGVRSSSISSTKGRTAILHHGPRVNASLPTCANGCMQNPGARSAFARPSPSFPCGPPTAGDATPLRLGRLGRTRWAPSAASRPRKTMRAPTADPSIASRPQSGARGARRGPSKSRSGGVCHFPAESLGSTAEQAARGNGEPSYCLGPTPAGGMQRARRKQHLPSVSDAKGPYVCTAMGHRAVHACASASTGLAVLGRGRYRLAYTVAPEARAAATTDIAATSHPACPSRSGCTYATQLPTRHNHRITNPWSTGCRPVPNRPPR